MKNKVNRTLAVKKNNFKKSFVLLFTCLFATTSVWAVSIYKTDLIANPAGGTATGDKGEFTSAPSWATGYSNCYHTTGSAGAVTITFSPAIDLSAYTNCKFNLAWGAESNRPVNLSINGGTATQIDAVSTSSDRSKVRTIASDLTVTSISSIKLAGSGGGNSYYLQIEITGDQAGPSTDATLSSLTYNGTSVPDFSPTTYDYPVELPAGTTTPPTVAATTTDSKAQTPVITQATTLPGTATIVVTAEDGTTTLTYTVTFTVESAAPKVQTATWDNIKGTAAIDNVNLTITGQVTNGSSLNLTPTFIGKNIQSWNPQTADFSGGPVIITFTSPSSETTIYAVTITEAPPVSTDATLKSLKYNGTSVPGFLPTQLTYNIEMPSGTTTPPTVTAEKNDSRANDPVINQATYLPGTATVVVTAEDGETQLTYTINFTVAVPGSDLTIHVPDIYAEKEIAGGYNTPLTIYGGREYEVFYINRDGDSKLCLATLNGDKAGCITNSTGDASARAKDGWLSFTASGSGGDTNGSAQDEFGSSIRKINMQSGSEVLLHIKGYDQFSFYGKDNSNSTSKCFEVYINGVKQTTTPDNTYSIRRFPLTTGENLIRITALSTSSSVFVAFSLRVAQEPRTKWLKGNDSTQNVLSTTAIKPIYYFTKYNSLGETKLIWDGDTPDGITLTKQGTGPIGDTLMISGVANCLNGTYNYHVSSFYNGVETSRADGKINVIFQIKALTDTIVEAYIGEEMDEIRFRTYLTNNAVKFRYDVWPDGIDWNYDKNTNILSLGGTPTQQGTYEIDAEAIGGNTIHVKIIVKPLDLGNNPVLYLYKNNMAYEQDGVYKYLTTSDGGSRNLIARKAKADGLRPAAQYANYKWILISEDVDADNPEVLAAARGETGLPVLNMKSFSYSPDRLDWGEPDNGSLTKDNGRYITVLRGDHPIFQGLNKKQGDRIQILDTIILRGLMPAAVDYEGTLCLATAWTRDIEDYHGDGVQETFLHEVPASMNNGKKYICMPIGKASSEHLTADGKRLVKAVVNYLLSDQATVSIPELKITGFKVNGIAGTIDQDLNTIDISIDITKYPSLDLTAVVPEVTVASPLTHVTPLKGEPVDLSKSSFSPVVFEVSDYINRRTYDVTVRTFNPQSIDEVYTIGEWVNIYDIYGRKLTTTNENIYTMSLPHGVYMVVTANGQTIKILR